MDNSLVNPLRSQIFKDIGRRNASRPSTNKNPTIERLSTPKPKDKRWIPDRPSVYWLDYLIDPTPHKIKDPDKLASYYDKFEPKFPRTKVLSAPRPDYGSVPREEESLDRPTSVHSGIPISALTYTATDRIKELARPKTSMSGNNNFTEMDFTSGLRPTTSFRQSVSTARSTLLSGRPPLPPTRPPPRSYSPKVKVQYFDPNVDLARGDFPSRSKHAIHFDASHFNNNNNERVVSTIAAPNSNYKLRSRSTSNYHKMGSTVTRDILRNEKKSQRPLSRTLYSVRH